MKNELPWLFSGEMVRALLADRKSQSRRVVDLKNIAKQSGCTNGTLSWSPIFKSWAVFNGNGGLCLVKCPYVVGQKRWVRETWAAPWGKEHEIFYRADGPDRPDDGSWKPSIFMPHWASRITLAITQVRVQRLQSISPLDIVAEGMDYLGEDRHKGDLQWYRELWDSLNGKNHPWSSNPYIWAISFRKL